MEILKKNFKLNMIIKHKLLEINHQNVEKDNTCRSNTLLFLGLKRFNLLLEQKLIVSSPITIIIKIDEIKHLPVYWTSFSSKGAITFSQRQSSVSKSQ